MLYERSREIEAQLADLVWLIQGVGLFDAETGIGTRHLEADRLPLPQWLRDRGYSIRAVKGPDGWAYELRADSSQVSPDGGQQG